MFKNWKCNNYKIQKSKYTWTNHTYQQLKDYFAIKGIDKVECIKNFGMYAAGTIYNVKEDFGGFVIY